MSENNQTTEIEQIAAKIEKWREQKSCQGEKMPNELWREVIALYKNYPQQAQLQRRLGITKIQIQNKLREFGDDSLYNNPAELCQIPEIPQDQKSTAKPTPTTQDNFSSLATIVVELCRKDGAILKIHTTTQNMQEIINSFMGSSNATINCQA